MSFYLCFLKGTLWSWSHGCTICEPFSLGYQAHVQLLQPFYQIQMNHLTNKPYFLVVIIPVSSGPNHLFSHFLSTFQYFVLYFQMVHLWGNPFFFFAGDCFKKLCSDRLSGQNKFHKVSFFFLYRKWCPDCLYKRRCYLFWLQQKRKRNRSCKKRKATYCKIKKGTSEPQVCVKSSNAIEESSNLFWTDCIINHWHKNKN